MTGKTEYLTTHLADIEAANLRVTTCAIQLAKAKESAKGAKALYDDAIDNLRSVIGADKPILFIDQEVE